MNKRKEYVDYQEILLEELKNPEFAVGYLNESLKDKDQRVFLLALKNVFQAQGGDMTSLAKEINISRQNIYRILSTRGNPRWENLSSLLDKMGLEIQLSLKRK